MLNKPRQKHYVLGHEAFRLFAEHNRHQFFGLMSSPDRDLFIDDLIARIDGNYPADTSKLSANEMEVQLSIVTNHPLVLIKMPPVQAYCEAIYVGVLGLFDINDPESTPEPEIGYFTFEVGQGEGKENVYFFCQWDEDTHHVLGEMDSNVSLDDFSLLIQQRLETAKSSGRS